MVYKPTYNWGALQPPRAIYRWEPGPPAEKQPSLSCGFSRPGHSVEQYWRPTNSRARKQSLEYHGISWIRWWWKKYKNMTWNSRLHHKPRPSRRPGHPFGGLECQWPAEEWQDCRLASSTTGAILIISLSLSPHCHLVKFRPKAINVHLQWCLASTVTNHLQYIRKMELEAK